MRTQTLLMLTMTMASTSAASAQWPTPAPRADVERAMRDAERALRQAPRIAATVSPYAMRDVERAMVDAQRALAMTPMALEGAAAGMAGALAGAEVALSMAPMALSDLDRIMVGNWRSYWFDWERAAGRSFSRTPPRRGTRRTRRDSLYRAARTYLNRSDYVRAADLFGQIRSRYPKSTYTPDSYYWQSYALYRRGGNDQLRRAQRLLEDQGDQYASAATRKSGDARSLETRIQGALARGGDASAGQEIAIAANPPQPPQPRSLPRRRGLGRPGRPAPRRGQSPRCSDDDDVQVTALNALMQMDDERAMPILKKVWRAAMRNPRACVARRSSSCRRSAAGKRRTYSSTLRAPTPTAK